MDGSRTALPADRNAVVVFTAVAAVAGLSGGALAFGALSYDWIHHTVHATADVRVGHACVLGGLPAAAAAWLLAIGRDRARRAALATALRPAAAGVIPAVAQYVTGTQQPWPLYAWMASVVWSAWRAAPLIRVPELSRGVSVSLLVLLAAAIGAGQLALQYELWRGLSLGYHDIGAFARAIHNAAHGRGLWIDTMHHSFLGEHAAFSLYALVPFVWLGAHPFETLMWASVILLNVPAFIAFGWTLRTYRSGTAALLAGASWLLLPMLACLIVAMSYGFHDSYPGVPLLAAGLAATCAGRWRLALPFMLALLSVREDVSLTVAAWGVYALVIGRPRWVGLVALLAAIAWFLIATRYVVPHYRGGPYPHIDFNFGRQSAADVVRFVPLNASFLLTILLPMGFLPLRNLPLAAVAIPSLAEAMLTRNPELHNLTFHYYLPAVSVLFFAAISPRRPAGSSTRVLATLFVSSLLGQAVFGIGALSNNPPGPLSPPELAGRIELIDQIRAGLPPGTQVTASYRVAAHFTDVDRLFTPINTELGQLVVLSDRDAWDGSRPRDALARAWREGGYQPIHADYHFTVLIRRTEPTPLARELSPDALPADVPSASRPISPAIELVAMVVRPREAGGCRVTLVWRCLSAMTDDARFALRLADGTGAWGPFFFARGAIPTSVWQPGRLYRDDLDIDCRQRDLRADQLEVVLIGSGTAAE